MTNVENSSENTIPSMYAPVVSSSASYHNNKHPFSLTMQMSLHNYQLLCLHDMKLGLVVMAMINQLRRNRDDESLVAITVELPLGWSDGLIKRNDRAMLMIELERMQVIRKVDTCTRSRKYYLNPNMAHAMTSSQRRHFFENHMDIFGEIML